MNVFKDFYDLLHITGAFCSEYIRQPHYYLSLFVLFLSILYCIVSYCIVLSVHSVFYFPYCIFLCLLPKWRINFYIIINYKK